MRLCSVALMVCVVLMLAIGSVQCRPAPRNARPAGPPLPHQPPHLSAQPRSAALYHRKIAPSNWQLGPPASPVEPFRFEMALVNHNIDQLKQMFDEMHDPDHDRYSEHITKEELIALTAPTEQEFGIIYAELAQHGIHRDQVQVLAGDHLVINTNVQSAESLFATRMHHFMHMPTGMRVIKQFGEYSLPASVSPLVQMVLGVSTFPALEGREMIRNKRRQSIKAPGQSGSPTWLPQTVAAQYSLPWPIAPASTSYISAGVIEFVQEVFNATDLQTFSTNVLTPLLQPSPSNIVGNDSVVPDAGLEAELDIQWLEGMNPGLTPWFWLINNPDCWLYSWGVEFIAASPTVPQLVSMSYGLPELAQCSYFPNGECDDLGVSYVGYVLLTDVLFMKIGALGTSVIVCSQDRGTYLEYSPWVGQAANFTPEYPGTSAYATSVGATEFLNPTPLPNPPPLACGNQGGQVFDCVTGGSEQAVSLDISSYLSGGGFSSINPIPSWQAANVANYYKVASKLPPLSVWNNTGRGFPDVSAIGYNAYIIDEGQPGLVSGTSESTPIFTAILSFVAATFYNKTGNTLGFLNPLFYQAPVSSGIFKDITVGNNCESGDGCPNSDGFVTAVGWDPVTGLGTPNYAKMLAYVNTLADRVVARKAARQARLSQ